MNLSIKDLEIILKRIDKLLLGEMETIIGIKYVNFDYDNRTKNIWRITFRCWGKEKIFTNTNRPIEERRDLFEEIMEWLDSET